MTVLEIEHRMMHLQSPFVAAEAIGREEKKNNIGERISIVVNDGLRQAILNGCVYFKMGFSAIDYW